MAELDDQHRQMLDIANEMDRAFHRGSSTPVLGGILNKLITYARTHFAAEERSMREEGYPQLEEHKQEHEKLIDQALDLRDDIEQGETRFTHDTIQFLRRWVTRHTIGADKDYGTFLQKLKRGRTH